MMTGRIVTSPLPRRVMTPSCPMSWSAMITSPLAVARVTRGRPVTLRVIVLIIAVRVTLRLRVAQRSRPLWRR